MEQNQPNFGGYGGSGQMNPNGVGFDAASGGQFGVSGDVVFSSGESGSTGGKKKFVIIGVVLGVLAVVAVVLGILASGGGSGLFGGGELAGFSELKEFIENGDEETKALFGDEEEDDEDVEEEDSEDNTNEDYIMAIRISEQGEAEVRKYYAKLAKLEQEFYNKSATKVDSALLAEYGNALKVLKNAINYYEAKEGLIAAYENGGESGAEAYFSDNISCNKDSGDLNDVCSLEEKYYTAVLNKHQTVANAGCYKKGFYDVACAMNYYGVFEYYGMVNSVGSEDALAVEISREENLNILSNSFNNLHENSVWGRS